MPIDKQSNRKRTGQFNNKLNDEGNQGDFQELINILVNNALAPTEAIRYSPLLYLYVLSIIGNMTVQGERPNQQRAVQDTGAAFEADTFVEIIQQGRTVELHSLASSSTANPTVFTSVTANNVTKNRLLKQELIAVNPLFDLADMAHEFSMSLHKLAHRIVELSNCTTSEEASYKRIWGLFENTNHTQVHFKTICQNAIAESEETNQQRVAKPNTLQQFSFKQGANEQSDQQFTAENAAKRLKNIFQRSFEDTVNPTSQQSTATNATNETPMMMTFWEGLKNTFTTFFSEFNQPIFTEKQENLNGDSVISRFLERMAHSISFNEAIPATNKFSTNTYFSPPIQSTNSTEERHILKKEEEGFAAQVGALYRGLDETITEFLKRWDPIVIRGAEGSPINPPFSDNEDSVSTSEKGDGKRGTESQQKIATTGSTNPPNLVLVDKIVQDIEHNRQPAERYEEPIPTFYYDKNLFERKEMTNKAITQLKEFLVKQKIVSNTACAEQVIEGLEKWGEIKSVWDISEESDKIQFLHFFIRHSYGLEEARAGDVASVNQLQATFMQLKINVCLTGYIFQQNTNPIQLSPKETPDAMNYQTETSVSNQIFSDFIHDRPASIPKNQTITAVVYHRDLFNHRKKTKKVNQGLVRFAYKQGTRLKNPTASHLIRWMQKWILRGKNYAEIVNREQLAAKELLKAYGSKMKISSPNDSRAVIQQWENNNAQMGYTYKKDEINVIGQGADKEKKAEQLEKQRVLSFLRENGIIPMTGTTYKLEEDQKSALFNEREEVIDQRIVAFLKKNGIVCDTSNSERFAETVSNWALLEGANQKIIDPVKLKQLSQAILGQEDNGLISNKEAELTFTKWLWGKLEKDDSSSVSNSQTKTSKPALKNSETQWRSEEVLDGVELFLREKYLIRGDVTKEDILSGIGKWFKQDSANGEIRAEKIQGIATVILKELSLYGGAEGELVSDKSAENTVMKWVVENVLESPIEVFATKKILDHPNPSTFTIGELRNSFQLDELVKSGQLNFVKEDNPQKQNELENNIRWLWNVCLNQMLPNYFLRSSELSDNLLISDYHSLIQTTGSRILAASGLLNKFNQEEIRALGELFFESVSNQGVQDMEELDHLLLPALFTTAQLDASLLRKSMEEGNYKEVAISTFIGYFQRGYFAIMAHQEEISRLYGNYQTAVINFRRKQALVTEVINECERLGIRVTNFASEVYLAGGNPCPGPWIPRDLEKWYTELTTEVAESYHLLNRKLISLAIHSSNQSELDFMFSPETHIYEGSAELIDKAGPSKTVGPSPSIVFSGNRQERDDLILPLKETDILVAIRGNEERRYALKRLEKEGGYALYRVDKDPFLLLEYDLVDLKSLWWMKPKKVGDKIQIGRYYYSFSTEVHLDKLLSRGDEKETLSNKISLKHKNILYHQLYESGNDKTMTSQVWDVVSHFIPFYDCVVGIVNKDTASAVPNCLIDALLLVPVLGQVSSINIRFALGAARVIARGGITGLVKNSSKIVPKLSELRSLLSNVVRYIDPGIELLFGSGRFVIKNLLKLKNSPILTRNVQFKPVLSKLEKFDRENLEKTISKTAVSAQLPGNGPNVLVKKMKDNLYVKVSDYKKGDVYGKYFTLRGGQLREFEGPAFFTKKQKDIIDKLKRDIRSDETFIEEKNLYPKGYGDGTVINILKNGVKQTSVIKLNDQLVPVRIQPINGHGVRYDVLDGDKVLPVNYNGIEWYFESEIPRILHKDVVANLKNWKYHYEALFNPTTLSAPDSTGLMWTATGRSYIRFEDRYLPLIILDKENHRYILIKKEVTHPLMILRLDPKIDQFRFETQVERTVVERSDNLLMAGGYDKGASTSRGGGGADSFSIRPVLQYDGDPRYPSYMLLPNSPNKWQEWKKITRATEITSDYSFISPEDFRVVLPPLTEFVPELPKQIKVDEAFTRKEIIDGINMCLPDDLKNKFRVYSGLDASQMPPHLINFQAEISKEYDKTLTLLTNVIEECKKMLKVRLIGETQRGGYLSDMLNLYRNPAEEAVLKQAVTRILSIAERSKRFLEQSADWGFQNIWIAASDFQLDVATNTYYSSNSKIASPLGFVIRNDPENRIILIADSFNKNPNVWLEAELAPPISETLLHETTHLVGTTQDLVVYGVVRKGTLKRPKDAQIDFVSRYHKTYQTEDFFMFVHQLENYLGLSNLSRHSVFKGFATDPMLFANYMMTDAEMLSIIMRDIAYGHPFDQKISRGKRSADSVEGPEKGNFLLSMVLVSVGEFEIVKRSIDKEVLHETTLGSTLEGKETTTVHSTPPDIQQASLEQGLRMRQQNMASSPQPLRMKRSDLNLPEAKTGMRANQKNTVEPAGATTEISQSVVTNHSLRQSFATLTNRGVGRSQELNTSLTSQRQEKKVKGLVLQN